MFRSCIVEYSTQYWAINVTSMHTKAADGSIEECSVGTKIEAPAGIVHRTVGSSYRAVLGLSVDPTEMTQPVDKPVVA